MRKKVILYNTYLNKIGGIETFTVNFCKRLSKHVDITLLFSGSSSDDMLYTLSDYCDLERIKQNHTYDCDVFISATAWGVIPYEQVKACKYIQMIHACYDYYIEGWNFKYDLHPKVTHHVAVGVTVSKAFTTATTYKADSVIYNLLNDDYVPSPKQKTKALSLITCSRISREKGFARMLAMCECLKDVSYNWEVYGDTSTAYAKQIMPKFKKFPNVIFKGKTDIAQELINKADYLVQLSDSEGMPYSILESLQALTPVITTSYPSAHELIQHGGNGYIIDMALKNFKTNEILNIPTLSSYRERSSESDWIKLIEQ